MSGRYRAKKYKCKNCGMEFKTEGKPLHCPRCHSILDIKE